MLLALVVGGFSHAPPFGPGRLVGSLPGMMAQWRRCTNATALRFGRNYYLLTIAVAFTLWLCDQHFCVHLHSLLACHRPQLSQTAASELSLRRCRPAASVAH